VCQRPKVSACRYSGGARVRSDANDATPKLRLQLRFEAVFFAGGVEFRGDGFAEIDVELGGDHVGNDDDVGDLGGDLVDSDACAAQPEKLALGLLQRIAHFGRLARQLVAEKS